MTPTDKIKNELFNIIKRNEGFYSDDKSDKGGETVYGISRKNNPNLDLWKTIDDYKKRNSIKSLENNDGIIKEVKDFYYENYQKYFSIIPETPNTFKNLKLKLFDEGTNIWYPTVCEKLQEAINVLNSPENKISVDGDIGPETLSYIKKYNPYDLIRIMIVLISYGRIKSMRAKKKKTEIMDKKKYMKGWIRRDFIMY